MAGVEVVVERGDAATVRVPDAVVVRSEVAEQNPARLAADDVLLAVEIVSPGTGRTDRVTKLHEYALAGIPGYWVIDLDPPTTLMAHVLVDGYYEITAQGSGPNQDRVVRLVRDTRRVACRTHHSILIWGSGGFGGFGVV